jgi:RecA-family ATPase
MMNDTDRAVSALHAIPNGLSGNDWLHPSMGAKAAGIDFETWHDWCKGAANYEGESDCRTRWKSFDANGPIQAGTLYKKAAEHGWRINGNTAPRPAPARATRPVEPPRKPAKGMSADEVWGRCQPVKSHPYATRKKLADAVLKLIRVVPDTDPLTHYRGWLAVPGYSHDGILQTLEFVPPGDGKKMTLKDSQKSGASLTVGPTDGPAVVVEGLGHASAVFSSTGGRAVACFGSGNIRRVVEALRQKEPETKITIAPDRGKEDDAKKIAAEFNCAVACLPESETDNFDVNDLFCRDGFDVVAALLESAIEPPKPEPKVHPLARYVDIDGTAKPPRWVIPGFIGHGVTVIAGAHGVGKTTALLPLALTAAGLHGDDLTPCQWRHVVYVTEDVEQARRILAGITLHSNLGISLDLVRERVHIVEAVRLDPAFVATVGKTYLEQFTRSVGGVEVLPLVVLDTKSAVLALDNENDNAEASRMMAALKQGFDGLPVWLIGHVAKANLTRNDALTSRGASAIEGDANQTMFLIREGESRYLVQGKTRFEARWPELEITSYTAQTTAPDEFGNMETVLLRWGIAAPAQQSRKEAAEQAAELQRKEEDASLRQDVRDAVELAWVAGNPLNRAGVKAKIRRKASDVVAMVENLLSEQWLYEVAVPTKERTNNSKAAFLVNLTTEEHEAVLAGAGLPADKIAIPISWRKPAIPVVPAPESEAVGGDYALQ